MDIEIFLAILGVLFTIYSVASSIVKSRLEVYVSRAFWPAFIFLTLVALLSIILYEQYYTDSFSKEIQFWLKYSVYVFFFIGSWYIYSSLNRRKLTRRNIGRYYQHLKVLLLNKDYAILTDMLYGSLHQILSFHNKKRKSKGKDVVISLGPESFTMPGLVNNPMEAEFSRRIFRDIIFDRH